jgi:hypothetical protein
MKSIMFVHARIIAAVILTGFGVAQHATAQAQSLPEVQVKNVRRVFDQGPHNAFTDLIRWHDRFWLTFRNCPDGHMVHPTSSIVVMSSEDTQAWQEEHRFSVPLRDTRDPHFLAFKDELFIYTGTWYSGETTLPQDDYDLNKHLGYAVWTADGSTWQGPRLLEGTYGHYIWRAASFGDTAYLCARRNRDFVQLRGEGEVVESAMLRSDDGLVWRYHSLFQETSGDETAFSFDESGGMTAIGRRGRGPAQLIRSQPPYTEMTRTDLTEYVGGPLLTRWDGRWLVGGRRTTDAGSRTVLYWLVDEQLIPFAELPSDGDTSYPGFVELSPTHAVVSWYSSHEKDSPGNAITAIYMADLVIE